MGLLDPTDNNDGKGKRLNKCGTHNFHTVAVTIFVTTTVKVMSFT